MLLLGWSTFEAAVFVTSGDPSAFLALLPGWIVVCAAGALVVSLAPRFPWLVPALALGGAVISGAHHFGLARLAPLASWLPQSVAALALASLAAGFVARHLRLGPARASYALGLAAAQGQALLRLGWMPHHGVFLPLALALVGLGLVPRRPWRLAGTLVALAVAALPLGRRVLASVRLPRPDLVAPESTVEPGRPNLVLLVMDTVRADRLSCYGYERPTTPGLDAFARDHATLYQRARSTASWTLPAHASLFTGLAPGEHGADHPRGNEAEGLRIGVVRPACKLRPDVPTLAERLRAAGYRTGAVVANEAYLDHGFGVDRGFEHYDDRQGSYVGSYIALPQILGWRLRTGHLVYRDARRTLGLAREWLESLSDGRPFFLMVNLMDAHLPVVPPPPFDQAFGPERPRNPLAPTRAESSLQYDRGLAYLDAHITSFLGWLEQSGRFDDSVVIVTADHGEAFGEHLDFYTHAWLLYEELLHVPLLVKPAGGRAQAVEPRTIGLAQVHDLALWLTGVSPAEPASETATSEWYRAGANSEIELWAKRAGHDVGQDLLAWVEDDVKYIVTSAGDVEAYDLAQDPGETRPLVLSPERLVEVRALAQAWWDAHPPLPAQRADATLDANALERMRALGYAGEQEAQEK